VDFDFVDDSEGTSMLSRLLTRQEQFVLLLFGSAILVGSATLFWSAMRPDTEDLPPQGQSSARQTRPAATSPSTIPQESVKQVDDPPAAPAPPVPEKTVVKVGITGAVRDTGVYTLPSDALVGDLLKQAGGATEEADLLGLNLTEPLVGDTTIAVPFRKENGLIRRNAGRGSRATQ
jgi:hypothetical protein